MEFYIFRLVVVHFCHVMNFSISTVTTSLVSRHWPDFHSIMMQFTTWTTAASMYIVGLACRFKLYQIPEVALAKAPKSKSEETEANTADTTNWAVSSNWWELGFKRRVQRWHKRESSNASLRTRANSCCSTGTSLHSTSSLIDLNI